MTALVHTPRSKPSFSYHLQHLPVVLPLCFPALGAYATRSKIGALSSTVDPRGRATDYLAQTELPTCGRRITFTLPGAKSPTIHPTHRFAWDHTTWPSGENGKQTLSPRTPAARRTSIRPSATEAKMRRMFGRHTMFFPFNAL